MTESVLADAIRPFWLSGINAVAGKAGPSMPEWFSSGSYQIRQTTEEDLFVLEIPQGDIDQALAAFAADINRLATAAFETVVLIGRNSQFPRSTAWLLINSYYAAFFSAHAIVRILGLSCTQLGHAQVNRINAVADLYGAAGGQITRGLYRCAFDASTGSMICRKVDLNGVHESFWSVFHHRIIDLSNEILVISSLPDEIKQFVSGLLVELASVLETDNSPHGNWLSQIRNKVTYNQQLGAWYPYSGPKSTADELFRHSSTWLKSPLDVSFQSKNPLRRFQEACVFLVGLCRVLTEDVHSRSLTGNSFCRYGSVAFLRLLAKP